MIRIACICSLIFLFAGCPPAQPGPPTAAFTAEPTETASEGGTTLVVNFTDHSLSNGESIDSWLWNFGDGTTSTEQDPTHEFVGCATNGFFSVSLRVTNELGSDIHTEESLINLRGCRQ